MIRGASTAPGSVALWSWRGGVGGFCCFFLSARLLVSPGQPVRLTRARETGGPKMCGSADNSDAAKGLVVDAVVAVVAAASIYAVALF